MDSLTVDQIGAKCKSKTEFYRLLSTEGDVYLPPISAANKGYIRGILSGKKKYITCNAVMVVKVPHYKGLKVSMIIEWARSKVDIDSYLPEYTYNRDNDRDWVCNLVHTLLKDEFRKFISDKCKKRERKILEKKNLKADILPAFVNIFKRSQSISTAKGKSHYLSRLPLKPKDIEMAAEEDKGQESKEEEIQNLRAKLGELEDTLDQYQKKENEAYDDRKKLAHLFELGLIDAEGKPFKSEGSQFDFVINTFYSQSFQPCMNSSLMFGSLPGSQFHDYK